MIRKKKPQATIVRTRIALPPISASATAPDHSTLVRPQARTAPPADARTSLRPGWGSTPPLWPTSAPDSEPPCPRPDPPGSGPPFVPPTPDPSVPKASGAGTAVRRRPGPPLPAPDGASKLDDSRVDPIVAPAVEPLVDRSAGPGENPAETSSPRPGSGKMLTGSLFIPAGASRRERRRQQQETRRVGWSDRRARTEADRQERRAVRRETRDTTILPSGGERRRNALRSYRPLKVQPHRATSDHLAGVYPFLAEAGLGSRGMYIGPDSYSGSAFVFDPFVLYQLDILTNPNILVAGDLGTGKSTFAKSLTTRSIAFGRRVYVPGDPKGEWSVVARAVGGQAIELGRGLRTRLNPLDEGTRPKVWAAADGTHEPMTDQLWRAVVKGRRQDLLKAVTQSAVGRDLASVEVTALFAALDTTVDTHPEPTLPHVVAALFDPASAVAGSTQAELLADGRVAAHALNRLVAGDLAGLFDGPSTTRFDPTLPMVSLDLSRISGSDQLIALVMTCSSSWMEASLQDPESPQRFIVYDEAWRTLREPSLLARMQSQWKLARALGVSNMMVIHALSDLDAVGEANSQSRNLALGLLRDCATKVIYAQEPDQIERTCAGLGLSSAEGAELLRLVKGEALWRVGQDRSFIVGHRITHGPGSEKEMFDTNARMLDVGDR
jgi:hypothetical protein